MPRRARVVVPEMAHHVIQRGNYQQYIFENDEDFRTYLYLVNEYSQQHQVKIHAYCLMNNHVHFILTPEDQNGLAEIFRNVHTRFSQYKNLQKRRLGHLWQGRFYSCVLSRTHVLRAIRYVEMNPVRAKMVKKPWEYIWSSTRQHLKQEQSAIIKTDFHGCCLDMGLNHKNWKEYLLNEDNEMITEMRNKTQKGLAIGDKNFITTIEKRFGIVLSERKVGRPKKQVK